MTELKTIRFQMVISPAQIAAIDGWRKGQNDLPSRSEAARRLMNVGIEAEPIIREIIAFLERVGDPSDDENREIVSRLRGVISS